MFIQLSHAKLFNTVVLVNPDLIAAMYRNQKNGETVLQLSGGGTVLVNEEPADISAQIDKARVAVSHLEAKGIRDRNLLAASTAGGRADRAYPMMSS